MTSRHDESAAVDGSPIKTPLRRRLESVLEWTIRGSLALWLLAAIGVVMAFATPPRDQLRAADWQLDGGAANGFEAGEPRMIQSGPEPVWVVRLNDNTFTAFAAVCRLQHCVLRWNPVLRVFSCPCHHGTYDLEGRPQAGSSGEALRSFFVNIKAGRVRVHLRRVVGDEV